MEDIQTSDSAPSSASQTDDASHEASTQAVQTNETESTQEQSQEQNNAKPEGFDRIDLNTATPDQIKARMDRIYGNMKRYETDSKEQRALNEALVREFQSLKSTQDQVINHLQNTDYQEAETRISQMRMDAWNKGDIDGFTKANDQLLDIRLQKKLATVNQPKEQPQVQKPKGVDGERLVNNAREQGSLSPEEADVTKAWISETDNSGNFKRPWASDPSDPRNYAAALEAQAVFNSPLFANKPIAEKLREVDRRMGIQTQQPPRQNVLGSGNLTSGGKLNTIKLDPAIEKIAIRTKFGGPKAKTDQDHVEAWKRAVAKSKGGRQ